MRNMITRTFSFNVYTVMCVNKDTKEIVNVEVRLPKKTRSDKRLEADITASLLEISPDLKFVSIEAVTEANETRAMSEAFFIANSEITKNITEEENE